MPSGFDVGSSGRKQRDLAARSVEHDMVPPPQLLEEIAGQTLILPLTADFRDCAFPVDGGKQALLPRVDGQIEVVKGVIAIDEYCRCARRQSVPHGKSVRQPNGLVAWPG